MHKVMMYSKDFGVVVAVVGTSQVCSNVAIKTVSVEQAKAGVLNCISLRSKTTCGVDRP